MKSSNPGSPKSVDSPKVNSGELKALTNEMISLHESRIEEYSRKENVLREDYNAFVENKLKELANLGVSEDERNKLQSHFDIELVRSSPKSVVSPRRNSPVVSPSASPKSGSLIERTYELAVALPLVGGAVKSASQAIQGDPDVARQKLANNIVEEIAAASLDTAANLEAIEAAKHHALQTRQLIIVQEKMVDWMHDSKLSVKVQKQMEALQGGLSDAARQLQEQANIIAAKTQENFIYASQKAGKMAHNAGEYLDRKGRELYEGAVDSAQYLRTEGPKAVHNAGVYLDQKGREALQATKEGLTHAGENIRQGATHAKEQMVAGAIYTKEQATQGYEYAKKHQAGDAALRMGAGASLAVIGGPTGLVVGGAALSMAGLVAGAVKVSGQAMSGIAWGGARTSLAVSRGVEDTLHKAGRDMGIASAAIWHKPKAIMSRMKIGHYQSLIDKSFELAIKDLPKEEKAFLQSNYQILKQEDAKYVKAIVDGKVDDAMLEKLNKLQEAIWDKVPAGKHKDNMTQYNGEVIQHYDICTQEYGEFRNKTDIHKEFHEMKHKEREADRDPTTRELNRVFTKIDEMFATPANSLIMVMPEIVKPAIEATKSVGHLLQGESVYRETRIKEHEAIGGREDKINKEVLAAASELARATSDAEKYNKEATKVNMTAGVAGAMEAFAKAGVTKAEDHLSKVGGSKMTAQEAAKGLGNAEISEAKGISKASSPGGKKDKGEGLGGGDFY